jgi:hypothetical protein
MKVSREAPCHSRFLFWAGSLPALAACAFSIVASSTPNHTDPPPSNITGRRFPLEVSPNVIDLGILRPRHSAAARLTLRNPSLRTVIVEQIQTSCPCLQAEKQSIILGPQESAALALRFDSSDDSDFRGGLSIEVVGRGVTGGIVFATRVNAVVRAEPADQGAPENSAGQETADLVAVGQGGTP